MLLFMTGPFPFVCPFVGGEKGLESGRSMAFIANDDGPAVFRSEPPDVGEHSVTSGWPSKSGSNSSVGLMVRVEDWMWESGSEVVSFGLLSLCLFRARE